MTVRETVNASKVRFGAGELAALLGDAKEIVVAKGKSSLTFKVDKSLDWGEVEAVAVEYVILHSTEILERTAVRVTRHGFRHATDAEVAPKSSQQLLVNWLGDWLRSRLRERLRKREVVQQLPVSLVAVRAQELGE